MIFQEFASIFLIPMFTFVHTVCADGHAHSFQNFHGPTIGDGKEITWEDQHGNHHQDYISHPRYEYAYGIDDHHTGDFHGQKEHRDGENVKGEYAIKEPTGNIRTVKYYADKTGFHAHVHNSDGH